MFNCIRTNGYNFRCTMGKILDAQWVKFQMHNGYNFRCTMGKILDAQWVQWRCTMGIISGGSKLKAIDPYAVVSNQFRLQLFTVKLLLWYMVSYESILCDLCGDEVCGECFEQQHAHEVRGDQQPSVSVTTSSSAGTVF